MLNNYYYTLDKNHVPVPCGNAEKWADWCDHTNRIVAREVVGPFEVSTVFTAFAKAVDARGAPLLFETRVYPLSGQALSDDHRYSTWRDALAGHARVVAQLKAAILQKTQ